jgi:hypothetical protein
MKRAKDKYATNGTSFHGQTFRATVNEIARVCGEPDEYGDPDDKVQYEWGMETEDGTVFTIYDWKEYRRYSKDATIEWHIGAHNGFSAQKGLEELMVALNN